MQLINNTLIGFIVGILGTSLGAIIALLFVHDNKKILSLILSFTAGIMLSIVTFDLIYEAIELSNIKMTSFGIFVGTIIVVFMENILYKLQINKNHNKFIKSGLLMAIAIAIHNIPEGLAIGSGFMFTSDMGFKLAIIISLHNLPEGIAMATPLKISGFKGVKIIIYSILAGIPTGIGAFFGTILGGISNSFIGLCFAIAAGTMLYITCGELIPNSKDIHNNRLAPVTLCIGFIIGIVIINIL